MQIDVVFEPFGANAAELVRAAALIDAADSGFDGLWVYDHFTAMFSPDRQWSRDPFVLLGAYAAVTTRLRLGTLVANVFNRHVVQLAAAINSVQSIADRTGQVDVTRVVCGLGSGAAPGSRFAAEQDAIGTELADAAGRRDRLVATIGDLRTIWRTNTLGDATDIVAPAAPPKLIVGASGPSTITAAGKVADGVNIRDGAQLDDLIDVARTSAADSNNHGFEISVLTTADIGQPRGGIDLDRFRQLDVDRVVLGVRSPFDLDRVVAVGHEITETRPK